MNEKTGLEAVWDNANFNKGNAEYLKGLASAQAATGQTSASINEVGSSGQQTGSIFSTLAGMLGMSTTQMFSLAGAIGVGVVAFKTITAAVGDFVDYMIKGEDSAINLAARISEMNLAAQAMGQLVGYDGAQIQDLVKQLTSMEIGARDANQVIADFARYNLDLAQVVDLATVAENASVLANKSATETFVDLATGIERMMVRQLKSSGIVLNATDAYQKYADANHTTVEAMSETEQQQAFLNEVIAKGANLAGLHEVAMRTAAEQMDKLQSKTLPGLKAALGAPFQAAFYNVVNGINNIVIAFTNLIKEGGVLYPVMVQLGAIFELMTEPLRNLGKALMNLSDEQLGAFAQSIANTISAAVDWGANLVINFANGMIDAASTVLIAAIDYIAGLLSFWMSPGSPPKFLPNIETWGSEAMEMYLQGFTEADFSVLNDIQSPLEAVLGSLTSMGELTKQAADGLYVSLSEAMIQALAGGGLTDELLANLTAAGGIYGDELADLARKEFDLAGAENAVTDAEKALTDAKKRETDAGVAVNKGMAEYNQMLRGGASKQALAAKMAEINANKKAQVGAGKDIDAKQTALDIAKAQLIATQDQIKAMKDMLKVMIDLNKAQIEAATPAAAAAAGGGGGGKPKPTGGGGGAQFDPSKVTDAIKAAIDEQVAALKEKYGLAFTALEVKFLWMKRQIITALAESGLLDYWDKIKKSAGEAWEGIKTEAGDVIKTMTIWWSEHGQNVKFIVQTMRSVLSPIYGLIGLGLSTAFKLAFESIKLDVKMGWDIIKGLFKIDLEILGGIVDVFTDLLKGDWSGAWEDVKTTLINVGDTINETVRNLLTDIKTTFNTDLEIIKTDWGEKWDAVSTKVSEIWDAIKLYVETKIGEVKTKIDTVTAAIKLAWDTFWDGVNQKVTDIWNALVTTVTTKVEEVKTAATGWIDSVLTTLGGYVESFKTLGGDLLGGLVDGITNAVQSVIDAIVGAVQDAIDAVTSLLDTKHSPSELFKLYGKDIMEGLQLGIEANAFMPTNAMRSAMVQTVSPAAAIPITMGATNNYYQPNINMPTTINNGMNAAVFQSSVKKIVRNEMNRK